MTFEVNTRPLRRALTAITPLMDKPGSHVSLDRVRFELHDNELILTATNRTQALAVSVPAKDWTGDAGLVFDLEHAAVKKLLAVHVPSESANGATDEELTVSFDVVDSGRNLRTQDTSGLFTGGEELVVPLAAVEPVFPDVFTIIGSAAHAIADLSDIVSTADKPRTVSLKPFDAAVRAFSAPLVIRQVPGGKNLFITIGVSAVGVAVTHDITDECNPKTEPFWLDAYEQWLTRLPSEKRDIHVTGPEPDNTPPPDNDSEPPEPKDPAA